MTKQVSFLVVVVSVSLAGAVAGAVQSDPGLLGQWEFTSSSVKESRVADQGRTGLGTILGPARLVKDNVTEGLALDGRTQVMITEDIAKAPLPRRAMTVAAWVYVAKPQEYGGIVGAFQDNGDYERGWLLGYRKDRFCLAISCELRGKMFYLDAETPFELNRWYHVAGTFDGEQMKIYVNGQLEGMSKFGRYDIDYPPKAMYVIGAYHDDDENFPMVGRIHEVRVYDRVLKQGEIRRQIFQANVPAPMIVAGPYLQEGTRTTQTIMWETDEPGTSVVEYGEKAPLVSRAEDKSCKAIHEITLKGLKPQTPYFYRACSRTARGVLTSPTYTFQTAVMPDSPLAFVVMGDTFTWVADYERPRIFDRAWAERPNFVLHVGDVVSDGPKKDLWAREWLLPAGELMARVPLYVTIGNHERDAHWFYDYVSYPRPENYYSFDYGNAHFAVLDSNKPAEIGPGGRQYQWLDEDLGRSKATWKFVALHAPPYSSDDDDYGDTWRKDQSTLGDLQTRKLVGLFEKHGVDVVWCGHIHTYERTWPIRGGKVDEKSGVVYIQTGGGGSDLEEVAPVRSWFTAKVLRNWQYCLATIHGGTFRMRAYDIEGRLYDLLDLDKK